MTYSDHRLYIYDTVLELVLTEDNNYLDNKAMHLRKVTLHKGMNNTVRFAVTDRDRKRPDTENKTFTATLVNPTTRRIVFSKLVEDTGDNLILKVFSNDIQVLPPGVYTMFVSVSDATMSDQPVYSDIANNVRFDVQVTNQASLATQESTTVISFLPLTDTGYVSSGQLSGNQEKNFLYPQHTMAIYTDEFTGILRIQATCLLTINDNSPSSTEWFTVEEIPLIDKTGITHRTFVVNANWIRVIALPDTGSITQILLKN